MSGQRSLRGQLQWPWALHKGSHLAWIWSAAERVEGPVQGLLGYPLRYCYPRQLGCTVTFSVFIVCSFCFQILGAEPSLSLRL